MRVFMTHPADYTFVDTQVKDREALRRMKQLQQDYPVFSNARYAKGRKRTLIVVYVATGGGTSADEYT